MAITSKGQVTIPVKIRCKLNLHPGDVLKFDEDEPFLKATKAFDVSKMRSVIGCCREKAGLYGSKVWLDETRGPVDTALKQKNENRG